MYEGKLELKNFIKIKEKIIMKKFILILVMVIWFFLHKVRLEKNQKMLDEVDIESEEDKELEFYIEDESL